MKIREKISFNIIPLIIIILIGFNILLYMLFAHYHHRDIQSSVETFLENTLHTLVEDIMFQRDYIPRLSAAVTAFSSFFDSGIAIVDGNMNPVISSVGYDIFEKYSSDFSLKPEDGLNMLIASKEGRFTKSLYSYRYMNNSFYIYTQYKSHMLEFSSVMLPLGLVIISQVAILFIMILIVINSNVIRPIKALEEISGFIAESRFDYETVFKFQQDEFGSLHDIMSIMKKRLRDAREALLQKIKELKKANDLLFETQKQLLSEERFSLIGKLSSSIAHEIGNPLNGITGYIDLLKMGGSTLDDTKQYLEGMEYEISRIQNLIYSLLDSVSLRHNKPERFNPYKEIDEIKDILLISREFKQKSVSISINTGEFTETEVFQYREFFRHIVFNLLHNALKFSPDNSNIEINIDKQDRSNIRISFRDYGKGMVNSKKQKKLTAGSRDASGTGLGLYLSSIFAEYMNGSLSYRKPEGSGSLFELFIPVSMKEML